MEALEHRGARPRERGARRIAELVADGAGEDAGASPTRSPRCSGSAPAGGIQETLWAVRRLLERLAARGPVVVVFDDIHWAEPTFLDLVEYLGDWIRSVPVLIVCQARPELLEIRPSWLTAKDNATPRSRFAR